MLHRPENSLGMRHHDREATVGRCDSRNALRRAIRIEWIRVGRRAAVVDKAQCHSGILLLASLRKVSETLPLRYSDRGLCSRHPGEKDRR